MNDPDAVLLLARLAERGWATSAELQGLLGKSQPTISHHLKVLREAGLVTSRKKGTWVHYRAVPEQLALLQTALGPKA